MFTVMVCGSRDWVDRWVIFRDLDSLLVERPDLRIIHGGAAGADRHAQTWVLRNEVEFKIYVPDYAQYGSPTAQHLRNDQMLASRPDAVLAYILNDSPGTTSVVRKARRAGLYVIATEADDETVYRNPLGADHPSLETIAAIDNWPPESEQLDLWENR